MNGAVAAPVAVLVPADRARGWTRRLAEALGRDVAILPADGVCASGSSCTMEALERRLYGVMPCLAAWVATCSAPDAAAHAGGAALAINATERDPATLTEVPRVAILLTPLYHGAFAVGGVLAAAQRGAVPHLGVLLTAHGQTRLLCEVSVAVPDPLVDVRALEIVFTRVVTLLRVAAEHVTRGRPLPEPSSPRAWPLASAQAAAPMRLLRAGLTKAVQQTAKLAVRLEDWGIAYRPAAGSGAPPLAGDLVGFHSIELPSQRFYADPMIIRHNSLTALFFEDYDYATARGCISHVVLHPDGTHSSPAPVLKRPYHLSYPFVFSHDGTVLMIPETSGNQTVELYEAEVFPARWRLRCVLMQDIIAADVTLYRDLKTGLWWMFATVSEPGGSSWDTLSLFYSDRIEGPWHPHAANPVKLDSRSSRPAGPVLQVGGRILRPAQDCAHAYGQALVWCEVTLLTPTDFREVPVARLSAEAGFTGLHTYCRAAGFEAIDRKRRRCRWQTRPDRQSSD